MVQWLAEWLIKHGTNPVTPDKLGLFDIASYQKAIRLGYIETHRIHFSLVDRVRLTKKGIEYLKENDK